MSCPLDLGYQGELGYQTFLYSSEPEIRRLLIFLVEKLPRDAAEDPDQPAGKTGVLHRAIAASVKAQLSLPWVPPSCRTPTLQQAQGSYLMQHFHAQPLVLVRENDTSGQKISPELTDFYQKYLLPVSAQPSQPAFLAASLLELNMAELSGVQEWESEWKSQGLASRLSAEEYRSRKRQRLQKRVQEQLRQCSQRLSAAQQTPGSSVDLVDMLKSFVASGEDTLTKGSRFTHTEKFTFKQEPDRLGVQLQGPADCLPSSKKNEQDIMAEQQQEAEFLQQQLDGLNLRIEEVGADLRKLSLSLTQVDNEMQQTQLSSLEKDNVLKIKKQALDLLPDAENNLSKLQMVVESSAQRIVHLATQWEKHRVPLIEQHRQLKKLHDHKELESSRRFTDIKELHDRIRAGADEAKRKEELHRQLIAEYENLPKDVSRAAYTQRILEIVGNIKKQKEEITKILSDTKDLQKEINSLTGKLERTFAVTDELVFKDAKQDESVRKAYKYLAALHENCLQLIETIEDTGTIMREIRDLEEQIETETTKKTLSNLEKILSDYRAIKQENASLLSRAKES
ncbi:coiled-coil domain-containing protein 22 isoform X2 [Ambystoma mexicanum]|uniref:coiled-coil domain-containing protein 22 isoform X2 n=1 Tax=Ambystoma mexicanum TaxID=8296 RepID=UPI0037E9C218